MGLDRSCIHMELENVFRNDKAVESLPVQKAINNAPQKNGQYFCLPKEGKIQNKKED